MRSGSVLAVLLTGCLALAFATVAGAQQLNFRAHLTGAEEVPPVATQAQGQAIFQVASASNLIHFKLNVANIENITQAHIHRGALGENGPVVAWLYPAAPPAQLIEGRFSGVLSAGVINVLFGPLAGQTIAELVEEMLNGNTYVNVHTSQHPGGEVRGQIFAGGPEGRPR